MHVLFEHFQPGRSDAESPTPADGRCSRREERIDQNSSCARIFVGLTSVLYKLGVFLFCSHQDDRRSRRPNREQDAVPDNWHRVGAPGGAGPLARARAPGPPPPSKPMGPGILARIGRSQGRSGSLRKAPGASRRSNPSFRGEGKACPSEAGTETAGRPERPNSKPRVAECCPDEQSRRCEAKAGRVSGKVEAAERFVRQLAKVGVEGSNPFPRQARPIRLGVMPSARRSARRAARCS